MWPGVYQVGLATLRHVFGLEVVEYPSTAFIPDDAPAHPAGRAVDLNRAFADPTIQSIVTVIGGDDSVRILPYVDFELAAQHPKVLLGCSGTTTQLFWLATQGILSRISGLIVGQPRSYTAAEKDELDAGVLRILAEWEATDIPILTGADFGHTHPQ